MKRPLILCWMLLAVLLSGCVANGGSAQSFSAKASDGSDVDYEPLRSPKDAYVRSDLISRGKLVDVQDGMNVTYADAKTTEREAGTYVTLVIEVAETLAGPNARRVYVQLSVAPSTSPGELRRANPDADVLVIAENIDTWKPSADAKVSPPADAPDGSTMYYAFNDGLWLQGPADSTAVGIRESIDNLRPDWGKPQTVDDLMAALRVAR